jgi:hypothetical protein
MIRAHLAFDVVSIKPSSDTGYRTFGVPPKGNVYWASGRPLGFTILMADFPIRMGSRDRFVGAPG